MSDTDLEALAAKVEALKGPCRETDAAIGLATGFFYLAEPRYEGAGRMYGYIDQDGSRVEPGNGAGDGLIPRYTASIDAAMSLVPEELDWILDNFDGPVGRRCSASINSPVKGWSECHAATPALALTAACLRARARLTPPAQVVGREG